MKAGKAEERAIPREDSLSLLGARVRVFLELEGLFTFLEGAVVYLS